MSTTEAESLYQNIEQMSTADILRAINTEDRKVPDAMAKALPALTALIDAAAEKLRSGGRLFYIGAGTSGRLGVVDASECPPTFGVSENTVVGLIAGGDTALRKGIEGAEDSTTQGWADLQKHNMTDKDFVVGIAASGRTPYVLATLLQCRTHNIKTGCIVCNENSVIAKNCDYPVEIIVGPEFITGSTRMKAGTAQKLALNMISTSVMIRLDRVEGNRMVHMQLSNDKLVARGTDMVIQQTGLNKNEARALLLQYGNVKQAVLAFQKNL